MVAQRYDRQERFFGKEGQERIAATAVAVVGLGGVGSHVVQQLALLGVSSIALVDDEGLAETDRNRNVLIRDTDAVGQSKVELAARTASELNGEVDIQMVPHTLVSYPAFEAIRSADYVFGCLDSEGARLILNELCLAYDKRYVDIATGIDSSDGTLRYGGQIQLVADGQGCLVCVGNLDLVEASADLAGEEGVHTRNELYGIKGDLLDGVGPSVVSMNGIIASLAVMELTLDVSGIREPAHRLRYEGHSGRVTRRGFDDSESNDCYYCRTVYDVGLDADVEKYIREGVLQSH